jgi:hypothetical protein
MAENSSSELLGMPKLVHDDGEVVPVVAPEGVCLCTASLTFFSSYHFPIQLPIKSKLT